MHSDPVFLLVARTLDSTNFGIVWDKFHVYQGHRQNTPFIQIGKRRKPRRITPRKEANAIKQALAYRELLDNEEANSQGELARLSGIPRTTISAYLRLLNLDGEIQDFARNLDESDERLRMLTEPRLRPSRQPVTGTTGPTIQPRDLQCSKSKVECRMP